MRADKSADTLDSLVTYWLHLSLNRISQALERRLSQYAISPVNWMLLLALSENPTFTEAQLAQHLGMSRSFVSKAIERLARRGLIARKPDREDRRRKILTLTNEALLLLPRLNLIVRENEEALYTLNAPRLITRAQILRRGLTAKS